MEADPVSTGNGRGSAGETSTWKGKGKGKERTGRRKGTGKRQGEGSDEDSWDFFRDGKGESWSKWEERTDCWNDGLARVYTAEGRKGARKEDGEEEFFFSFPFFLFVLFS